MINPITHGVAGKRYTDYEVRLKTNLPVFRVKESSVRRRYSDFEWLRNELERDSKVGNIVDNLRFNKKNCFIVCVLDRGSAVAKQGN